MEEEEKIEEKADEIEKPIEKEEIEENIEEEDVCDPTKMNCDELGDHIIGLVEKRIEYTDALGKLDEVKKVIESEEIDKIYQDTEEQKQKVDDEIYLVAERAIACRTLKPEEKEETLDE